MYKVFFLCWIIGVAKAQWIRIPVIIYSSHVVTTLLAIFFHILFQDFSQSKYPGPRTQEERITLCSIYAPFLVIPFINLLDASISSAYWVQEKVKRG